MSTINTTHFPAQELTKKYKYDVQNYFYNEWISDIPFNYIQYFVEYGILPFLKLHGYTIDYTLDKIASCLDEWAFHHVLITQYGSLYKTISFITCSHDGGEDEHDWFHHRIATDDWFKLCSSWAVTGFLDDSDTGRSQQLDISNAVWNLISLTNSPSHHKWQQHVESLNYQDHEYWSGQHTDE
jgi:hypothetical protein